MDRFGKKYDRQPFGLDRTLIGGASVQVTEEILADKTYCALRHFKRDTGRNDPKVLLIAPMSGHHATLLRGTIESLLPAHDVYIADWKNARDVPVGKGGFGLDDYIAYVRDFIRKLGPDVHVMTISQSTVPALAAVSLMAQDNDPAQPLSLTMMGGPIDARAAPTVVSRLAEDHPLAWFEDNLLHEVPPWYAGAGQKVYPGFLQLFGFMAMHPDQHVKAHMELFRDLAGGAEDSARKIREHYDEYLAACDLPGQFYLDTVKRVFQDHDLARGRLVVDGRKVNPAAIQKTAIFTVEGGGDDIVAPGQTVAAHRLCKGLRAGQHFHYLQDDATHFDLFDGDKWNDDIAPRIAGFVRQAAAQRGVFYDAAPTSVKTAEHWTARTASDSRRQPPQPLYYN
jgi:poly(3-hydroxybutyrate) depolymerase